MAQRIQARRIARGFTLVELAGGDRHHRRPGCAVAAGHSGRPRSGTPHASARTTSSNWGWRRTSFIDSHKFFPSSGWGDWWVGCPDQGMGERQPGKLGVSTAWATSRKQLGPALVKVSNAATRIQDSNRPNGINRGSRLLLSQPAGCPTLSTFGSREIRNYDSTAHWLGKATTPGISATYPHWGLTKDQNR